MTSKEYEVQALESASNHMRDTAFLYATLAIAAAIREQSEPKPAPFQHIEINVPKGCDTQEIMDALRESLARHGVGWK